jgi:hypothetical protein
VAGLRYDEAQGDGKQARARLSRKEGGGDTAPISVAEEICDRSNLSKKVLSLFFRDTRVCLSVRPSVDLMYAERHRAVLYNPYHEQEWGGWGGAASGRPRRWRPDHGIFLERAGERGWQLIQSNIFFEVPSVPILVCDKVRGAQSTVWYRRVQVSVWPERATALIAHGHDVDDRCSVLVRNAEQQQRPQES